jgi:aspartate aminotransferase
MLQRLGPQAQDKIIHLMALYRSDPRPDKIDLGVGVYRDASGQTPVMRAIRAAGQQIWQAEVTKTYTQMAGEPAFTAAMIDLILGGDPAQRVACAATPGGTGALRQAFELIRMASPQARVWLSNPTWPHHATMIQYLGLAMGEYRYFDAATRGVDMAGMLADLGQVAAGDVVLLHGCCHNPTGANLGAQDWAQVAQLLAQRGAVPLVDLAYQGFGDGLEADAAPTRALAAALPQMLIAASCSKNFGIYRERTGILMALSEPAQRDMVQANLNYLNRLTFSFPPDHGARLVTTVLTDPALCADWMAELEDMRQNMLALRQGLADALRRATNSDRFDFVAQHRGMFSRLGLDETQVVRLRSEFGIYMVGDSRINIAGLNAQTVPVLAAAIAQVI